MKKIMNILLLLAVMAAAFFGCSAITGFVAATSPANVTTVAAELPSAEKNGKLIRVPYIYQKHGYPNGCEPVCAVMALWYYGIETDVNEFIDGYLPLAPAPKVGKQGPDPDLVFCGDPREKTGWGCYAPVITRALEGILSDSGYTVTEHHGESLGRLCQMYIDKDIPVIIWATVDMTDTVGEKYYASWTTEDGKEIVYNRKLHCLVLVGYDDESYYFNDPMVRGRDGTECVSYPREAAEKAYSHLGMQSIAVIPLIDK